MIKRLIIIFSCLIICLSLTACSTGFGSLEYNEIVTSDKPTNTLIAQNSKHKLELDKSNMGFILTDINTAEQWSTTPIDASGQQFDEFGMPIKKHPKVESVLAIECKNFDSDEKNTYYSYNDAVKDGKITYKKLKNGILINYYFAEAKVMIPLECQLTDDGVKLSVDPTKIQESENRVVGISIAPFFCAVKNDLENSYLFIPSGSGAIMGVESKSEQGNSYSAQIYGYDPSIDEVASTSNKESVKLNVFGAKINDKAVVAIVDGSPSSALINANAGSTTLGYSSCYASFQMRGYTNHVAELFSYEKVDKVVYSKKMINKPISVTFCPLSGEDANYSGMAKLYREYLIKNCNMTDSGEDVALNIRMLGGTEITKSFVGIPYKSVSAATTLEDAKKIIDEIKKNINAKFSVQLKGFGESGLDVGKIAGNYTVSEKLGSLKSLKELFEYSKDNGVGLFFDFDIERFNTNSSGITKFSDAAVNAGEQKALQYNYDVAVRDKKTDTVYNLLSPDKFTEVFEKVSKVSKKYSISGISLDTVSEIVYSDYANKENSEFYSKNGFVNAANSVIDSVKSSNKKFMASSANIYAAVKADFVSESPTSSEKNYAFLYDVPFYQMVFKGSVPITVESINLASDPRKMILKAVESGSGLGYTVINNWDNSLINADSPYFYNSVFKEIKADIFKNSQELSKYYKKISGKHISSHTVFENGLRETVFENGVCVYVNYTDKTLETPVGELLPYKYLISEK